MVFGRKKQEPMNQNIAMSPNFQNDDVEQDMSNLVYNQNQQYQPQEIHRVKPTQRAVITKVELTSDKTIKFEGEADYLINLGDCQINQ